MNAPTLAVSLAFAIALAAACSSSSGTPAGAVNNGDDAALSDDGDDSGGCPARQAMTCAALTMNVANYDAGANATPAGFPAPPPGSTLCGTIGIGALTTTEVYLSADDAATLFAYYTNAFMLAGYEVMTPVTDADCGQELDFVVSSPEAAAPLAGSIVWLPDAQAFEINNPS